MQAELEALWAGTDEDLRATSDSIIGVTITDSITDRQTEAISITIAAALAILAIFFWVTQRQPVLALVAVVPIVFVLIWVLGTMALLGIPYSLITSIITALSIGIGVDYTIHLIHRYRDEYSRLRDPERGRDPDAGHDRLGAAGFGNDDRARPGRIDRLAAAGLAAVRDHGGDHDRLLADPLDSGGAAGDDGLGRVPEHAPALGDATYVG